MTDRTLCAALLLVVCTLTGCGACGHERKTRRIDLGLKRSPETASSEQVGDASATTPAGDEVAESGEGEGDPAAGDPAAGDRPSEATAATGGTASSGAGASPPQSP